MSLERKTPEYVLTEAKIDAVKADIPKITSGSYTGNNTANRAIAHGLGVAPKIIIVNIDSSSVVYWNIVTGKSYIMGGYSAADFSYAVTAMDDTNFYVGNATSYAGSANDSAKSYYWVAFG